MKVWSEALTKKQIPTAQDSEIIFDYVATYSHLTLEINFGGKIKALSKHLQDLETEIIKRRIMTKAQIEYLNK